MAIIFDKEGNLIRDIINYKPKQDDLTKDVISEINNKYFCSMCDTYHKKRYRGKLSQTFQNHKSFMIQVSNTYIYNKKLKQSFKRYDINKHKHSVGSRKQ